MIRSLKKIVLRHAKNHFIPHRGNQYHPHILHHKALFFYSIVAILLKAVAMVALIVAPSSSLFALDITSENILTLTNAARASSDIAPVQLNERLTHAAQAKANDMAAQHYFAHVGPSGARLPDWLQAVNYAYLYSGENLAVHYQNAESLQEGWMTSAGHRANILNPRYTELGIGIATGDFEGVPTIFAVEMFGRPLETAKTTETSSTSIEVAQQTVTLANVQQDRSPISEAPVIPSSNTQSMTTKTALPPPQVMASQATAPALFQESSLKVRPVASGYRIQTKVERATQVYAQTGNHVVPLTQTTVTDTWQGTIPTITVPTTPEGTPITLSAWNESGSVTTQSAGTVLPNAELAQVYTSYAPPPVHKLFGIIPLSGLQDAVRRVYVFWAILLGTALLLNVFIKMEIQRPRVIVHTIAVIGLFVILLISL